jgi:hypothetical protein
VGAGVGAAVGLVSTMAGDACVAGAAGRGAGAPPAIGGGKGAGRAAAAGDGARTGDIGVAGRKAIVFGAESTLGAGICGTDAAAGAGALAGGLGEGGSGLAAGRNAVAAIDWGADGGGFAATAGGRAEPARRRV